MRAWTWRYSRGVKRSDVSRVSGRSADLCHRWQASEQVSANVYLELFKQHVAPWVQRMYLGENTYFDRFFAGPHHQDHPAGVGGILDSGSLAAIFTGCELAWLLDVAHFADERPGDISRQFDRPKYIHCRGWNRLIAKYIRSFCRHRTSLQRKMKF